MRFDRTRRRNDEEHILPLINVVLLLLIFFMLAGRLAASDPFPIEPPASVSEGRAEVPETVVLIGADGRLAVDGEVMGETLLKARIGERMSREGALRVQVKADRGAEATRVVAVMELLRQAGVETLMLLTMPKGR